MREKDENLSLHSRILHRPLNFTTTTTTHAHAGSTRSPGTSMEHWLDVAGTNKQQLHPRFFQSRNFQGNLRGTRIRPVVCLCVLNPNIGLSWSSLISFSFFFSSASVCDLILPKVSYFHYGLFFFWWSWPVFCGLILSARCVDSVLVSTKKKKAKKIQNISSWN